MRKHFPRRKRATRNVVAPADERTGQIFEVEIERIVPGGFGLAHAGGYTLLCALAAPGDRVEVEITSTRGRACFARIKRIIEFSPARITPPCPYFGRCGGCDFQQLDYNSQLAAKLDIIRDAMRRTSRLAQLPEVTITPAPREWNYRSRIEWQHDALRSRLGYFERGSHAIVDVTYCPVAAPELERTLAELRAGMHEEGSTGEASEFRAMVGDAGEVALTPRTEKFPRTELRRTIRGETYRYSAECFFQINHDLLPDLIAEALRPIQNHKPAAATQAATSFPQGDNFSSSDIFPSGDMALDLYCGVGLFTLPLARLFRRVIGVESHTVSASYARTNLAGANLIGDDLSRAQVANESVKDWLARNAHDLPQVDFVLLDPPRAGAEAATVASLINLKPSRIAYVSCDPVTLARDIGLFSAAGYKLESLRAFDLFPQTHHVETVAHLAL
jgi:23S rRNA (uracil1939-C5)-methyltransferase